MKGGNYDMDFDSLLRGVGNVTGRMVQQHKRDFENYLRSKAIENYYHI